MKGKPEDIIDQYERNAHRWDAERPRVLFEKDWLDSFLQLLPPAPSILEIGPGAGEPIAQYLIDSGAKLTGLDSSSSMIEICQARFPNQNWHVGDMRELSFPEIFDGIIAWDSFFHLTATAQRDMFPLFNAHVSSGGALIFTSGPQPGEEIGNLCGEPLFHASLANDDYENCYRTMGSKS
jgi:trans-aconitate methyltransferase